MGLKRGFSSYVGYTRVGLNVIKRRWVALTVAFLIPNFVVITYLFTAPPKYRATGKVILEPAPGKESLGFIKQPYVTPTDLANQIERIKSDEVIDGAVALASDVAPEELVGPPPTPGEISKSLSVSELKGTDIINISVEANDSARAAALTNLVIDSYVKLHVNDQRKEARSVREFIDEQVSEYERRLRESEKSVESYKKSSGTVELGVETENVIKNLAEFDRLAEENAVELAGKRNRLLHLESELREFQDDLKNDRLDASTLLAEELQNKLVALEYRYSALLLKGYTPDHEEMVALTGEIELARLRLAEEMEDLLGARTPVNPFDEIRVIGEEMAGVRASIAELDARKATLDGIRTSAEGEMKTLPGKEVELAKLTREKRANEEIYLMLLEKREEARIAEAEVVGNARVFSRAVPPVSPVSPNKKQSIFLGVLSGLLFGVGAMLLMEYADRTVRTPGELKSVLSSPVVGVIPVESKRAAFRKRYTALRKRTAASADNSGNGCRPVMLRDPRSVVADAYRGLRVRFLHSIKDAGCGKKVIAVTSASPQEGKTSVAVNLAVALASVDRKVCLVDADVNRPTVCEAFGLEADRGYADVLSGDATLEDVIVREVVPNLSIVPGTVRPGSVELTGNGALPRVVERLRGGEFDFVIFDTAPLLSVADTLDIAEFLDGYLLVLRAGHVDPSDVVYCEEVINQVGGDVVGVVLNCVLPEDLFGGKGYYYYSHYYYRYGDRSGASRRRGLPAGESPRGTALTAPNAGN